MAKKASLIKRIVLIVLLVAVAGGGYAFYVYQSRKPKEMVLSGSLEARTVMVGSLTGGRVTQVLVDEGAHVTAGETIVRLETVTIDRQIAEQAAAIAAAEAQLTKAINGNWPQQIEQQRATTQYDEKERQRYGALFHEGIVAHEQYDEKAAAAKSSSEQLKLLEAGSRKEDIAAARAAVAEQKAQLSVLQKQRTETDVVSSVNGVVQSLQIRPGDLIAPNEGVAELLESDQLWVRVYVPETQLGLVHLGTPVSVSIDTYPNRRFSGHIAQISSQGEYTPRNVQTQDQRAEEVFGVKIVVDPDPALKAGIAATVNLGVPDRDGAKGQAR